MNRSSKENLVNRYVRQYKERKETKERRKKVLLPFKIAFSVIFVIIAAYFAVQIYTALRAPMTTATASETAINRGFSLVGYFVRSESVIAEDYDGRIIYNVADGDKIGRYDEYASVYSNTSAADLKSRVLAYTERLKILKSAATAADNTSSVTRLSDSVYSELYRAAKLAGSMDYATMTDLIADMKSDIVTRELINSPVSEIETLISVMETRIDSLSRQIGSSETVLKAPASGYFSSHVDGYESVFDTAKLSELTPSVLRSLAAKPLPVAENQVGRIVDRYTGYFISNLTISDAATLLVGQKVELKLDVLGDELLELRVESLSEPEGGEVTAVFSFERHSQELLNLRRQSAVIVLDTYTGLKVPREAVRVDDKGRLGVYVITGLYTEFKAIDILYETDDYYVVATDPTTTSSLLKDDTIIVTGKNLTDRKVVD